LRGGRILNILILAANGGYHPGNRLSGHLEKCGQIALFIALPHQLVASVLSRAERGFHSLDVIPEYQVPAGIAELADRVGGEISKRCLPLTTGKLSRADRSGAVYAEIADGPPKELPGKLNVVLVPECGEQSLGCEILLIVIIRRELPCTSNGNSKQFTNSVGIVRPL
jgi:hypothetical protein